MQIGQFYQVETSEMSQVPLLRRVWNREPCETSKSEVPYSAGSGISKYEDDVGKLKMKIFYCRKTKGCSETHSALRRIALHLITLHNANAV